MILLQYPHILLIKKGMKNTMNVLGKDVQEENHTLKYFSSVKTLRHAAPPFS
jgi:hypothetical protein